MWTWLKSIKGRTPDQLLVSLAVVVFLFVVGRDLHQTLARMYSRTGVLMRVEGIETQANATARNVKEMTADLKAGVKDWRKATTAQLDFVQGALPGLTGQLQNNLDYLSATVNQHLNPAIDKLGDSASKLGDTADAATETASAVSTTLTDHLNPVLDQATGSLARFNDLLGSKDLDQALGHAYGVVGNIDAMTADGAHVTGLVRKRLDPWLDPPPCRGKHCIFIHTWNGVRYVLPLTGPVVNIDRIITGAPY